MTDIVERLEVVGGTLRDWSDNNYETANRCNGDVGSSFQTAGDELAEWSDTIEEVATKIQEQAAEIERLRNPWVPIDDIPDEWKNSNGPNGGYVDVINSAGCRFPDAEYVSRWGVIEGRFDVASNKLEWFWRSASGNQISEPKFAMLPPKGPSHE